MEACLSTLLNSDLSSVLSACEPELQELMRQIDIMMSQQRSGWEAQMRDLQLRLKSSQEDISACRVLIQRKDLEIGILRKQVEDCQGGRQDLASKYEKQLEKVREELDKLKMSYQKLERRHMKRAIIEEPKSKEEDVSEVRMLKDKPEVQEMRAQLEKVQHELHTQEVELQRFRALENTRLAHDRREQQDKMEEIERLHNEVRILKRMLHDKEEAKRSLEECLRSHDFASVEKLREDLERTSAELDRTRNCEAHLNTQVTRLKERLEEMSVQHVKMQQEARVLKDAFDASVAEVKRLQEELSRAEHRHSGQMDVLRKQGQAPSAAQAEQDQPPLRPEITQTLQATGRGGPVLRGHADDHSKTAAGSDVGEGTSFDGDILHLFTQLHSRQQFGDSRHSSGKSVSTKLMPEGRSSVSPTPPDVWTASSQVDATVSHYLEKERLHSKELLHKLDAHILGMGDSNAASVAKRLNGKSS